MNPESSADTERSVNKLNCKELAKLVRGALAKAKKNGTLPSEWKMTVSCDYAGYTKKVRVKVKNYRPCGETVDLIARRGWERKIEAVINEWNYNNSQIEYDHFDVGYYTGVVWK